MSNIRLSRLELRVMGALWKLGTAAVREIQESLPDKGRPAYNTVQTILTRLEAKQAVRRTRKIGNAYLYEPLVTRGATQRRLVDELLTFFDGRAAPLVSHLLESGQLTMQDIEEARKRVKKGRQT